jgi:hypothetical protein
MQTRSPQCSIRSPRAATMRSRFRIRLKNKE